MTARKAIRKTMAGAKRSMTKLAKKTRAVGKRVKRVTAKARARTRR
jgi:hypothetical protein